MNTYLCSFVIERFTKTRLRIPIKPPPTKQLKLTTTLVPEPVNDEIFNHL